MLDIKLLRESPEKVKKGVATKNVDAGVVDEFLRLDEEWRQLQNLIDNLRAEHNKLSKIRNLEEAKKKKEEIKLKESELKEADEKRNAALLRIPNLPFDEVPVGGSEKDNVVMREVGEKPKFDFKPKSYLELAEKLNLVDTERAAKTSGSRFGFLLGAAARLEFALVQLAIKVVTDRSLLAKLAKKNHLNIKDLPFVPVVPPVLINKKSMSGMGYLERGAEEVYYLPADDLYLVGTAEQSIGPMHQDEVFEEKDLPRRYIGFSTCFRREAGSYGKDTKGILRVHQFDKLEMFVFATPEKSRAEHRLLLAIEEHLMQLLCLPYRVLNICSADLGDPAAAKFDIEAWLPGQNGGIGEYRETHSTSNTTDFQARRLNVKYRPARDKKQDTNDKKSEYVHMLNGTAFAIGRTLIAIMENYQTKEGKIKIPKVLQKYIGEKIIG
jgi:seryl-tRNA synthetase